MTSVAKQRDGKRAPRAQSVVAAVAMKQKKAKSGPSPRPGPGRKRKDLSDVSPSTSLPPLVEGQLRCFLKLTVSKIVWTVAKPPASFLIRVRWWGETSDGTTFVPRDTSQAEQKALKTTTRYPIRCGPKQFASYLTDMGTLILEVMAKSDHFPIGRVQISGLAQLTLSHPISGFFTIVSPTSVKMGELQVSLVLEPLSETYDGSSSIPNAGVDFNMGLVSQGVKEAIDNRLFAPSLLSRPPSTNVAGRESVNSSRAATPRGKDHLYFQENSENVKEAFWESKRLLSPGQHDFLNADDPKQQGLLLDGSSDHGTHPVHVFSCNNPPTKDLLSALLDKGNRLRNAMVVSAMKSNPDPDIELYEASPVKQDTASLTRNSSVFPGHLLDGAGSPLESFSLGSDMYDSELNEQSLLEKLFYAAHVSTSVKSDSSLSDFFSDEVDVMPSEKLDRAQESKAQKLGTGSEQKAKAPETELSSPAKPHRLQESSMEAEETHIVNLSLDRLTVLGRIHIARVVIESLKIPPEENTPKTPGKKTSTGKPPRPVPAKKRTYFVEYHFPVGASKNGIGQLAITTEIVRVASSKISGEVVKFQQRHVFPVHFSGTMITHWWNSNLVFHIYLKKGTQQKPLLIGSADFPLRDVIQSEELKISCELPVKEDGNTAQLATLKVSLELAADNKDFGASTRTANLKLQAPVYSLSSPRGKPQEADGYTATPSKSPLLLKQNDCRCQKEVQETSPETSKRSCSNVGQQPVPVAVTRNLLTQMNTLEEEGLLLHVLLMIPEGKIFALRDAGLHGACNVYLNCKLFNTEEATRSAIVWGTTQPIFQFSQVTPVSLTSKLLERLKNNVMIIEAWNKVPTSGRDTLLGLAKLPLHQFYVSFKDPRISTLLLQAQYPVLAVDGFMPVVDVFTGNKNGCLKVVLAMGSADQIVALQRLRKDDEVAPAIILRPPHSLDPPAPPFPKQLDGERDRQTEHIFEIHIERIRGLMPLQSTVWGEADCYVQYHFPVQELDPNGLHMTEAYESGLGLKPFRSAMTLCVPDPTFSDEHQHSLLVPADVPVQRLLLGAFSSQGLTGGGGIPFEIWCRYYYPNVRDQMVARGTLSLSRLCAMVTMKHQQEVGIQSFSLPLIPRTENTVGSQPKSSGVLDVSIRYRQSVKTAAGILAAQVVSISVQIHSAAGLQAAVRALAEKNPSLQYSAEVGVNACVSVHIPFLPETEKHNTRAVARTFCPEFEHHTEFPCNLVVQRSSGESCCLGELLQVSEIIFSVFHKSLHSDVTKIHSSQDYLLGTVKVPTKDLLFRRSGIRGWYPITLPENLIAPHCANVLQTIVGGLELSVTFARPGDRERVLDAAKLLGWSWEEADTESLQNDSEEECRPAQNPVTVTVSIPKLWLPVQCVLLAGQAHLNKNIYCYLRYKLYDQEAMWTSLRRPKLAEDQKHVTVTFKKSKQMDLPWSQALLWYLREERLELQVWRAYGNESSAERPVDTDRLIGSAYVDLLALGESSKKKRSVSGVFPLFRRNASNLSGAAVRVYIVVASRSPQRPEPAEDSGSDGGSSATGEEERKVPEQGLEPHLDPPGSAGEMVHEKSPEESPPAVDPEQTFAVSILVERAMHLSLKGSPLTERGVTAPSSYVSFIADDADNPVTTEIIENTDSPVWDFQQQTRLPKELLLDPQQTLVFKVWHKADVERVIGFASVDLSPLLSGFRVVCGWYNIADFSGQCQGQIKVAISPLENIIHLREERHARGRTKSPGVQISPSGFFAFQARDSSPLFPTFSTRGTEELLNVCLRDTGTISHDRIGSSGSWLPRHKEHIQNVRRFHESLQRAEGGRRLDSLSGSSHASLLTTLRKNLSELDDIQRYFSQKLTRPYPNLSSPGRSTDARYQNPDSEMVDLEGRRLLEKSNHLVSQVSNLMKDFQSNIREDAEEPSGGHRDGGRYSGANNALPGVLEQREEASKGRLLKGHVRSESPSICVDKEPLLALRQLPCERGMLYEFLGQPGSHWDPPLSTPYSQADGDPVQSASEEEYEEDVVEPRTLNEITTVTDKTSPWSSTVSEPEQGSGREAVPIRDADPLEGVTEHSLKGSSVRSSSRSSFTQDGPQSTPRNSPFRKEGGEGSLGGWVAGAGPEEQLRAASGTPVGPAEEGALEEQKADKEELEETQEKRVNRNPLTSNLGAGDFAAAKSLASKVEEEQEVLSGDPQDEEGRDSEEEDCPGSTEAAQDVGSSPGGSHEGPPNELDKPVTPSVVLSDPLVVPNFFLPPQHLEASMRLLSISSSRPLAADSNAESGAAAGTIPYRRQKRPSPRVMPAELTEQETKRIARIFSAQFSKE
uniref:C2 domain containing 3 centriole elongation regulator n=1 Tax=Salvator merianae TaxID=96440 RepID=A0A8D0BHR2_SALMN